MNASVWKYPLSDLTLQTIVMPAGARVLCVQPQHGTPTIWALVDPDAATELRTFRVVGTGWNNDLQNTVYVGTWQQGSFVWHLFEVKS